MSAPKVVEVLNGYRGTVMVSTEVDGVRYSWTATNENILGGGVMTFDGTETLDFNTYRREESRWRSYTAEGVVEKVSDEIAAHLDLVEQAAANYKSSGQVQ
jgi:hypothetical protein